MESGQRAAGPICTQSARLDRQQKAALGALLSQRGHCVPSPRCSTLQPQSGDMSKVFGLKTFFFPTYNPVFRDIVNLKLTLRSLKERFGYPAGCRQLMRAAVLGPLHCSCQTKSSAPLATAAAGAAGAEPSSLRALYLHISFHSVAPRHTSPAPWKRAAPYLSSYNDTLENALLLRI